ncbi:fumarate reductase [Bordetella sp. N]|nr:fumarate reductase [Bordetella sp. N]
MNTKVNETARAYDVVVVGCGVAGLSAAVAAAEAGGRVCVLERAPLEERGGNTRYTGAYLRMKSVTEVTDDFEEHFAANSGGYMDPTLVGDLALDPATWSPTLRAYSFTDPNVVSTLAERAPDTLAWISGFGVKFIPLDVPFPTSSQPRIVPSGGGLALIDALAAQFEKLGGTIFYRTAAQSLVTDDEGRIQGVAAVVEPHRRVTFRAPSVVLASGGFQGNAEMMTRYVGPRSIYLRGMSLGCNFNKGEGIRMALDIGAAPCGDFGSFHASPMDPRSNRAGPSMYVYPYGILVNEQGRRFVDEGPGHTDETYEDVTRNISAQPHGIAYCILDARSDDLPNLAVAVRTEQPAVTAATIAELAAKLGLPADVLEATVAAYNAACRPGNFNPRDTDGLATVGLTPPKSNWSRPLDKGPYKAYPIISSIVFTFGGLKVNARAQVLNQEGDAIPGLYAAGETQGLYYGSYTGATSVLKGAVFGRIAGTDAVSRRQR